MNSLPCPSPVIVPDFGARIPVESIVKHILALRIETKHFDKDEDWKNADGTYICERYKYWHEEINRMKAANEIPQDTRVYSVDIWADGFEANPQFGHNEFNSLQLYTLTVKAPKGKQTRSHTLPYALGFKKGDLSGIFDQMLKECYELRNVRKIYCGAERRVVNAMFIIEVLSFDMPERIFNAYLCGFKRVIMRRFGWSGDVSSPKAAMCPTCESQLAINHCEGNHCLAVEDCGNCTMWMDDSRTKTNLLALPAAVKDASTMQEYVKLSFELLINSAKIANEYAKSEGYSDFSDRSPEAKEIRANLDEYLKKSGYPPSLIKSLLEKMKDGVDILDEEHLPETWRLCVQFGITLDQFACLPMHMVFLGIEKNLLRQTTIILDRKKTAERNLWNDLVDHMGHCQKALSDLHLDWCLPMSYTGDLKVGCSNWQSVHCVTSARFSLVYNAPLDKAIMELSGLPQKILLAFKSVRVLFFCFVSRIMTDDKVDSTVLDHYVKFFLSACKRFHKFASERFKARDKDEAIEREKKEKKKRRRNHDKDEAPQPAAPKKRKVSEPFYVAAPNYSCMANIKRQIELLGPIKDNWEGLFEKYIQYLK